jgi:signal peptidase II
MSAGSRPSTADRGPGASLAGNALPWLWLSLLVIALDQASKWLALAELAPWQPVPVLPILNWTLVFNPGAAFSFLGDAGGWQRWLFTGLALAVSALLVWWLRQTPRRQLSVAVPYALILGGAIGNVIDRLRFGHVVDFVDVHWGGWHFPAFNVADAAISVGAAWLIVGLVFARKG